MGKIKKYKKYIIGGIIISIVLYIVNFLLYTKFYYKDINYSTILKNFIVWNNIFWAGVNQVGTKFTGGILDVGNIKIFILGAFIVVFSPRYSEIFSKIKSVQAGDLKLELAESQEKKIVENLKELKKEKIDDKGEDTKKIIDLLIDEPLLVYLLNNFETRRIKKMTIPVCRLKDKNISIETVRKIFECTIKANNLIINGIISEKESLISEIYQELKNNGAIYVKN